MQLEVPTSNVDSSELLDAAILCGSNVCSYQAKAARCALLPVALNNPLHKLHFAPLGSCQKDIIVHACAPVAESPF